MRDFRTGVRFELFLVWIQLEKVFGVVCLWLGNDLSWSSFRWDSSFCFNCFQALFSYHFGWLPSRCRTWKKVDVCLSGGNFTIEIHSIVDRFKLNGKQIGGPLCSVPAHNVIIRISNCKDQTTERLFWLFFRFGSNFFCTIATTLSNKRIVYLLILTDEIDFPYHVCFDQLLNVYDVIVFFEEIVCLQFDVYTNCALAWFS